MSSSRRAPEWIRRGAIAKSPGFRPQRRLPRPLLDELHEFDPGLEIIWWPITERWAVYRVAERGAARSEDRLIKELDLVGPDGQYREPGKWIVRALQAHDLCTRYGVRDPDQARRLWLQDLDRHEEETQEAWRRKTDEIAFHWAEDMHFAARGRVSSMQNAPKPRKPGRRERIYG